MKTKDLKIGQEVAWIQNIHSAWRSKKPEQTFVLAVGKSLDGGYLQTRPGKVVIAKRALWSKTKEWHCETVPSSQLYPNYPARLAEYENEEIRKDVVREKRIALEAERKAVAKKIETVFRRLDSAVPGLGDLWVGSDSGEIRIRAELLRSVLARSFDISEWPDWPKGN